MGNKIISKIHPSKREGGLEWVVLEDDLNESGGVFLFLHSDLNQPCMYDEWYENLEKAESAAQRKWGIEKEDWAIRNVNG